MVDEKSMNIDPITGAAGAHPVGTGVGAMGGAAAGAAVGAVGGPVGAVVGGVVGAVAGGLGGKAVAESVNPTAEEAVVFEHLGKVYEKLGKADLAQKQFDRAKALKIPNAP